MAELVMDPNNVYIENVNEELLRDSLESSVERCNNVSISTMRTNETDSHKTSKEHSYVSSHNDLAKVHSAVDKEPKTGTKKHVMKRKPKNMIELNKMNIIKKGQAVSSYSKMHQKKLGRIAPIEKNGNSQPETSGPNNAAIEFHKQLVLDGILTDKDEFNNFGSYENNMALSGLHTLIERDEYSLESTRSNETNMSHFGKGYFVEAEPSMPDNGYKFEFVDSRKTNLAFSSPEDGKISHEHQLPPVRTFATSVQSAPADIQYSDLSYEKSFRSSSLHALLKPGESYAGLNNSMTSLASTKSIAEHGDSMTYSGIYANGKQNSRNNYKPYTLGDYKRLKKQSKPGGLGPDIKSEEHQQKAKKAIRQKAYSVAVKQRNTSETCHSSKKKRTATTKEVSVQKQEANARREKALEYAKTIPKPITSKNQNVWKVPSKAEEEPQTLLAILQQRHENEKKAVDDMRKDLQAKLTTR
ncbi:Hypothetical predicted protein [Paramuricea clavata]|uniref:Uncharacterized protein n=1 Tax=Paramuricea clavata TaxID=317549 RepID=A0A7D9HPK1_PARCT|nr:Hypothetical predicted protein [Paramuricea clavata]